MPKPLRESHKLVVLEAEQGAPASRRPIQIITPGWGSSGYYSPEVLERAASNKVIPAGTHMYLNHATESEHRERPERDVEKLAAVLVEDARWDGERLIAQADLIGPNGQLVEAIAPYIGVSIDGSATDITIGEAEGRTGRIIEDLAYVSSVDFVTHAGRGGKVLIESASPAFVHARAMSHGIAESTVNDDREALHALLKDTYGADKTYVWVRDFDAETVWFEIESPDSAGIYGQTYERSDDGDLSLTGEHHEVRIATQYVPVNPAGRTNTQESEEDTMPQIEEARLRELEEAAGRVTTLEERATTAEERAEKAETELAEARAAGRTDAARAVIAEHEHTFDPFQAAGLLVNLPLTESGELDGDAFKTRVDEAAAKLKAAGGAGQVSGFGAQLGGTEVTEAQAPTRNAWGREIKTGA